MIKASIPIGPCIGDERVKYTHLKCERVRSEAGTFIRMPEKHVEKLQEIMGMKGCSTAPTPLTMDSFKDDESEELHGERATRFRTANGILQYVSKF
eukprot:518583-Lingulodinium_polyedra.AAC.1